MGCWFSGEVISSGVPKLPSGPGFWAVTAKMEMKFRNPAPAEAEYDLWGNLVEQRGKRLVLEARCTSHGKTIAEANALFLATEAISDISPD